MITRSILRPVLRPVTRAVSDTIRGFNPLSLFASGEQGIWLDPNDTTTLFQDSAGTTPVTAVGQPVGLIKDKSGRGNHASQPTSASRPVLQVDSGGRYYLQLDGVDDFLTIDKTNFKFLHDGAGATIVMGFRPSGGAMYHTLLNTGNLAAPSTIGFAMSQDDRTVGAVNNIITNGSGVLNVSQQIINGVSAASRVLTVKNALGTHVLRRDGTTIGASATEVGSPSAAASTNDLTIGKAPSAGPLAGRIYSLFIIAEVMSDAKTSLVERAIAAKTGVVF